MVCLMNSTVRSHASLLAAASKASARFSSKNPCRVPGYVWNRCSFPAAVMLLSDFLMEALETHGSSSAKWPRNTEELIQSPPRMKDKDTRAALVSFRYNCAHGIVFPANGGVCRWFYTSARIVT